MSRRRALSVTVLTIWAGAAAVIATACASGALDDADPNQTGGVPGAFGGSDNLAGGSGPTGSGGTTSASGASGTLGGSVGNGGSTSSNGGSATSMGGGSSSNGGATTTNGGTGSGAASSGGTATGNGGSTGNCTDTPPPNGDTCAHAVEYGWCSQDWLNGACARSCGKCASGATGGTTGNGGQSATGSVTGSGGNSAKGGATGSGGTTGSGGATTGGPYGGGGGQPPRLDSGTNGWASRFWDCCKPACGWKANVGGRTPVTACSAQNQSLGGNYDAKNACESGGSAHMCWSFAPWAVSDTLAYGYAAVNMGADYCGKCYQLQFNGGSHNGSVDKGSQALSNKTMIVQAINNGGVQSNQFDLLIPGGGVGDFDACSAQWGTTDLGERYGGFFLKCQKDNGFDYDKSKACAAQKCQSVFGSKPDLLAGCNWFVNWFGAPDNPSLIFKEITCPEALTNKSGLRR